MVDELKSEGVDISEIHIGNLKLEDVHHLISDSLKLEVNETEDLTSIVYDKTQGNAFFVTQFLKSLYEDSLLWFDQESGRWAWDIAKIKAQNITENVVEFMAEKIKKLDPETQELLISAASIGTYLSKRL